LQVRLTTLCENTAGAFGFIGEWGLSILVEAGGETVLMDTGQSEVVVRNAAACGIDLSKINKVVLSHGHADHTGGLRSVLRQIGKEVEVFAHPEMWGKKYTARPESKDDRFHYIGVPFCREELEGLGASFTLSAEPVWLNEYMVTTGEVPLATSFEKVDKNMYVKTEGGFKPESFAPDALPDDQALVIKTKKGLVLVLGCAHRGMVNTMIRAREITGVEKIYAVVGGTHLFRAGKVQLEQTIAKIKEFGVEKLGVSHCTGLPAAMVLAREFEDAFFFNIAGTVVEL